MDAEPTSIRDGFLAVQRLRASAEGEADALARHLRAKLAEMEGSGNRHQRRKAKIARKRIDSFETWYRHRLATIFRKADEFDPEAGTFRAVQEEASARLAAIFD